MHLSKSFSLTLFPGKSFNFCKSNLLWLKKIYLFFKDFIYLFERECKQGRSREREISRLRTERRAQCGAQSHNPEIMTWAEIKSQMFNWVTQASLSFFVFIDFIYLFEREWARACVSWGRSRGRGTSRLHTEHRTWCEARSQPWAHDLSLNQESDA